MKKKLIIETVSLPVLPSDRSNSSTASASEQEYRIRYEDPIEMLQFATAERMAIVKLLLEVGPLPDEQIAAQTGRDDEALEDDLRILRASEVLRLNAKYEYCFDYDGVRVTLECPLPTAKSGMKVAEEPRVHVDGQDTDGPQPESRIPDPNPAVQYARRIIHILMGTVVVLFLIDVIMFLTES